MSRLSAIAQLSKERNQSGGGRKFHINMDVLSSGGDGGSEIKLYRAKQGDNFLRVLPPHDPEQYFGYEYYAHRNIGINNNTFMCPQRMQGTACPVCELYQKKKASGLFEGDDGYKALRSLLSTPRRWLFFVIDTSSDTTTAMGTWLWDAPNSLNDEILTLSKNPRTGEFIDISSIDDPRDFHFCRSGERLRTKYSGSSIESGAEPDETWFEFPLFEDIIVMPSYEEMLTALGAEYDWTPDGGSSAPRSSTSRMPAPGPVRDPSRDKTCATNEVNENEVPDTSATRVPAAPAATEPAEEVAEGPDSIEDTKARIRARLDAKKTG